MSMVKRNCSTLKRNAFVHYGNFKFKHKFLLHEQELDFSPINFEIKSVSFDANITTDPALILLLSFGSKSSFLLYFAAIFHDL